MKNRRRFLATVLLIAPLLVWPLFLTATPAAAQTATVEQIPVTIGESGQEYMRAVRGRGIQSDILYLDERIKIKPPPPEPEGTSLSARLGDPSAILGFMIAVFAAMLLFTLFMGTKYGGPATVSLAAVPEDRRRQRKGRARKASASAGDPPDPAAWAFPNDLLGMADRRAALVLLLHRALDRTAEINNMVLGRSETARDVLRALPGSWVHLPALRRLVREEELVRFGGRDIPEPVFGECIEIARPLFQRGGRA